MDRAARQCNISSAMWHAMEYGKVESPGIRTIMKIAFAFALSLDELLGWKLPGQKPEPAETLPAYFTTNDFNKLT